MKKIIFFILVLCSVSASYVSGTGNCGTIGSNSALCRADDTQDSFDDFYISPTYELYLYFFAVEGPGSGSEAFALANWQSSGSNPYYYYGTGSSNPWATSDPLVQEGNMYLYAHSYGSGSSAGVTAQW